MEFKASSIDLEERTIEGYASTWDKDKIDDVIHKGAFQKSINEAFPKGKIKLLWQHSQPLGMPVEMYEDNKGLFVKAKISKTRLGDEALELMKDGVVNQMSIGYSIPQNKSFYEEGIRHITEVKLHEFSPVTFPCNDEAVITSVKSMIELNDNISQDLRDSLTKSIETLNASDEPSEQDSITQDEQKQLDVEELKNELNNISLWAITKKG